MENDIEINVSNFKRRLESHKKESDTYRDIGGADSGTGWRYGTGDYSRPIMTDLLKIRNINSLTGVNERGHRKSTEVEALLGVESSISAMIDELLRETNKPPLIIMDYGGGIGLSWCRLANMYEKEVKRGDVLFVVTNIEKKLCCRGCYRGNQTSRYKDKSAYYRTRGSRADQERISRRISPLY